MNSNDILATDDKTPPEQISGSKGSSIAEGSSVSPNTQLQEPVVVGEGRKTPPEPIINQEDLRKKLSKIPLETLREILLNQVDLEIRLKHKELKLTEEEIGKCESQMILLRKFFEIPNQIKINNEPNDFTMKYFNLLNENLSVNYTNLQKQQYQQNQQNQETNQSFASFSEYISPGSEEVIDETANNYHYEPVHSYRTRSTTSSLRPSNAAMAAAGMSVNGTNPIRTIGCLYRRTDGVIVKLTCPDCQRSNFSSAQGFLNHSRIAHSKEYTSQDAAALKCGEILPDHEQDEEGLNSLKNLKEKGIDANKNLNVNEIYFNGLSNSLNTVHRSSISSNSASPPAVNEIESINPIKDKSELMKKLMKNGITNTEEEYEEMIKDVKNEVKSSHLFEDEEEIEEELNPTNPPVNPQTNPPPPSKFKRRKSRGVMGISKANHRKESSKSNPTIQEPTQEATGLHTLNAKDIEILRHVQMMDHEGGPTSGTRSKSGTTTSAGIEEPDTKRRKK